MSLFRIFLLSTLSLCIAVAMQVPQWLHQQHPAAQGIAVHLNSDEAIYLARVQEALSGRPEQATEAFIGDDRIDGTQMACIEMVYGVLFSWTGWNAAEVLTFMDAIVPVVVFLLLVWFFTLCGFRFSYAVCASVLFVVLQLYNLNRPIHMRASFALMMLSLIGILYAARKNWWGAFWGGSVLGLLVGVYVWSFTFAWSFWGVWFVWEYFEYMTEVLRERKKRTHSWIQHMICGVTAFLHKLPLSPRSTHPFRQWHFLGLTGVVGGFAALPSVWRYMELAGHPLYEYGVFRSGMHSSHAPESFVYFLLFFIMVFTAAWFAWRHVKEARLYRPAFVMIFAAFLYMHQQMIHGITFNFVSHGIFSLLTAALCMVMLAIALRSYILSIGAVAAMVYMAAIGYDGRYILQQWMVQEERFSQQHLVSLLPILEDMPRVRILSDAETSAQIAGLSKHDVVYSVYLKNVLLTHEDIARRFCLTQIPVEPAHRTYHEERHLVFPDAVSAFGGDTRTQELALVDTACALIDAQSKAFLESYGVEYVLWNSVQHPEWNMERFPVPLLEEASGSGWTLYRLQQ